MVNQIFPAISAEASALAAVKAFLQNEGDLNLRDPRLSMFHLFNHGIGKL